MNETMNFLRRCLKSRLKTEMSELASKQELDALTEENMQRAAKWLMDKLDYPYDHDDMSAFGVWLYDDIYGDKAFNLPHTNPLD